MNYKYSCPAIFLIGPTAVGKTDLAISLVDKFPIEIVSIDSAMVYSELDIGTCKPSKEILKLKKHHLIDILEPTEKFDVGVFLDHLDAAMLSITSNNKIPIFVGGSMMFHKILFDGIHNFPSSQKVRSIIQDQKLNEGYEKLLEQLQELDEITFKSIDTNNYRRVERALEIIKLSNQKLSDLKKEPKEQFFDPKKSLILGMTDSKENLLDTAKKRLNKILDDGFLIELENLINSYKLTADMQSMNSINYKQFYPYAFGKMKLDESFADALSATNQLIKTQLTWMKKFDFDDCMNQSNQKKSMFFSDTINTYLRSFNK